MDSNGFYYTLSTISQTLAAAFGLIVVVAIFHLAEIAQRLSASQERIRPELEKWDLEKDEWRRRFDEVTTDTRTIDRAAVEAESEKFTARLTSLEAKFAACQNELAAYDTQTAMIRGGLRHSLLWTFLTIGLCLLTLPLVPLILVSWVYYVACLWLLLIAGLAIYCLISYIPLVLSLTG